MDDPLVSKAKADLEEIRQQIARMKQREAKLQHFLDAYADDDPARENSLFPMDFKSALAVSYLTKPSEKESLSTKDKVAIAVAEILADGRPRHTRELLAYLNKQGIGIGAAADQVLALSRILSNDKRFKPSRSFGWSLNR